MNYVYYNNEIIGDLKIDESPNTFEPHVVWRSNATNRGIYQGFLDTITYLRKTKHVIIIANECYSKFFDAFVKRGFMRKIGEMQDILVGESITNIHLYQASKT